MDTKITDLINDYINKYDRVIVLDREFETGLTNLFIDYLKKNNIEKEIIVITDKNIASENENIPIKQISSKEVEFIKDLYLTYQFSSKIRILKFSSNYGTLSNLVDTKQITIEDAFAAIIR